MGFNPSLSFCYQKSLYTMHRLVLVFIFIDYNVLYIIYTGCLQKNGAVSKINKKFISHLTWAKHTPSAAATIQVFNALIIILQCVHPRSHIHTIAPSSCRM
jgi:hypothetical protein